jgi:catalase
MTDEEAAAFPFNPFDLTKVWPHADFPLIEVGMLELNRNPQNYFAEVEQAAFNPANMVPGIGASPDKMLQARLFAYGDAQRYRLGVNHYLIPVNKSRCPINGYSRDGMMRVDGNYGSKMSYEPNSFGIWSEQKSFTPPATMVDGEGDFYSFKCDDADYFQQPGERFRAMSEAEQQRLFANTARSMRGVPEFIKKRHIIHCSKADAHYGAGVAEAIKKLGE